MKKLLFLIVVCFSAVSFAGHIYPTFDMNRSPWTELIINSISIKVESGVELGLTNPHKGVTIHDFMFVVDQGNLLYDISNIYSYPDVRNILSIETIGQTFFVGGVHIGTGSPVDGIVLTGDAYISVYEREYDSLFYDYELIGSFTVCNPVPEPATLMLLFLGLFGIRKCKS